MFPFRSAARSPRAAVPRRTRLFAERLEFRDGPAGLSAGLSPIGGDPTYGTTAGYVAPPPAGDPAVNAAPKIVDFTATETSTPGRFRLSGRVLDENPAGLTVTFGGVPSVRGHTTTAQSNGAFVAYVTLKRDGSDAGTITASTRDAQGLLSNVAEADVNPTPP